MRTKRWKTLFIGGLAATSLIAASCTSETPSTGRTFKATKTTVNSVNDVWNILCAGSSNGATGDEVKVLNIGFRVKMGVPGSASSHVAVGANPWPGATDCGPGTGGTYTYTGAQQAAVTFNNISAPDVLHLVQGAPLEITGVWAWKLEDDGMLAANLTGAANTVAAALTSTLNATVAAGSVPSDANAIVQTVLDAIMSANFFNLFGAALGNISAFADDAMGSGMYIGIGSSGTLANIIDSTAGQIQFPAIQLPVMVVPPDIGGGAIFSTKDNKTFVNDATNGGISGKHTTTYTWSAS